MLIRSELSDTPELTEQRARPAAPVPDQSEQLAADIRVAIAEEMLRRYPDAFEPQRSTRLLGGTILLLGFAAIAAFVWLVLF